MFSSGLANTSLAVAELMREFGHDVEFIQIINDKLWWDDCQSLAPHWKVVHVADAAGYDLIFEIDRLTLPSDKRARAAKQCIWIVRKPFLLQELESSLFPTTQTQKREFEGLTEIWMMDAAAAMEEGSAQALELLSQIPVRIVPYVWSPSPAASHIQDSGIGSWLDNTVAALKKLDAGGTTMPAWTVHVAETNTTNASSAVLPLVILREAKRRGTNIGSWRVHNADMITKSKFFMENIVRHCSDADVGLSGEFIGRQRCVEWARDPMSCVLSHLRFTAMRPLLLDVAWAGIPLVHNSSLLRDIGLGLERTYYSDNHIGEACDAIRRMEEDLVTIKGTFAPGATNAIRVKLIAGFSPLSAAVKGGWEKALKGLGNVVPPPVAPVAAPPVAAPPVAPALQKKDFIVGFCDMWESFSPEYNFFTLMLQAANKDVNIIGRQASVGANIVIFGPFGETWKQLPESQPKIHFTGENTAPVPGVALNLGFHHFDMVNDGYLRFPLWLLEIDWFGADPERIINPKPIPLERCTKIYPAELAQKKKFCAFVVSNPGNPARNAAFQWLSEYKHVDSAGRLFNNMGPDLFAGGGGGGGELMKLEFLKNYKFCLTYENNSSRGYVTEKYLHAKAAGCIPIYWGDPTFERDFNPAGCIDARNFKTPEELVAAVRRVEEDDAEWLKRFSVPALDPYRVAWAHRTMAECARRMFKLGGFDVNSFPEVVGDKVSTAVIPARAQPSEVEVPRMVTCATRKYLPSLQHWLVALATQTSAMPRLKATVFLSSDIPEDTVKALQDKFTFAEFEALPDSVPPADSFPDYWEPQHFAWKLWILNEMSDRYPERMVFYTDAGAFLCRWPKDWMLRAQASGLCFLEDPREENRRWCSPEFCATLKPTEAELAQQQIQAALILFRGRSSLATAVFSEAYALSKRREVIAGPKWAGVGPDGKPFGHRHDQSILSILSARNNVPRIPLDEVYCDVSLRKTFTSGRAIYVHRGNFQVHKPFAERIDDAFVINLDRRADRLDRLWSNCPELKGRVERWPAIEGRTLQLTPAIRTLLDPNDFFWKKAIAGCALSHLGLWWKLAHENPDIENYLIMEDDVKFGRGWEAAWKAAAADIPEDYDIIYLGGVLPPNRKAFKEQTKERVNDSFCRIKENTSWGQKSPNRYFHFCAYAYVLSKRGAQKVLDLMDTAGGYWTSADHILCNPVNVLKSYILDPMVAGCYQDDDPKYANSQFNDFSRIDGFDSDLWNNDERFTGFEAIPKGELNIEQALKDARGVVAPAAPAAPAMLTVVKCEGKAFTQLPKRFVCISDHNLNIRQLHECDWLLDLFGRPSTFVIDKIRPDAPPPTDAPVVILQRPWVDIATAMLEKWDSFGANFSILHLSDEHLNDNLSAYSLAGCEKVLRFYQRGDLGPKVSTIPLGFHWTLAEGSQNPIVKTPKLPFRNLAWSFFGTDWNGRGQQLKPLYEISGAYDCQLFKDWNDASALPKDKYISTLLDTVFVPCPDGVNPETFRFYEALECGCIPLLVRTDANAAWVDWVCENLQLLPLSSWSEAAKLMEHLLTQKPMLEAYRHKVLTAWIGWRLKLQEETKAWIGS
jgi:GR25 family glycosyltransferase involved in LPS biosynthesis